MRIHRLTVQGFGPFRHEQALDFASLNLARLFLVEGPTGSGKSSLIDAIVFALFGTLSGTQSDSGRIRSDHCLPDEPSEVCLEFSVQGRLHRITRTPAYQRPKLRGSGLTEAKATQVLEELTDTGDVIVSLTSAEEIGTHVRDLLGMSAAQFRQLVVLPQGEFDALLRMRPAERLAALADLLGTRFFEQLQAALVEDAAEARTVRAAADAGIAAAVARIEGAVRAPGSDEPPWLEAVRDARAPDADRLAALAVAVRQADQDVAEAAAALDERRSAASAREEAARVARQRLDGARDLEGALARLREAGEALDDADAHLRAMPSEGVPAGAAERAGALREWSGAVQSEALWEADAPARQEARALLAAAAQSAAAAAREMRERMEGLPVRRAELVAAAEAARVAHAAMERLAAQEAEIQAGLAAVRLRDAAAVGLAASEAKVAEEDAVLAGAAGELASARALLDDLRARQAAQAAARLAASVRPGAACPVCGSTEHPSMATAEAGDLVHDGDIGGAVEGIEAAEAAHARASRRRAEAASAELEARREFDRLAGAAGEALEPELAAESERVAGEIAALRPGLADVSRLAETIDALDDAARTAADDVREADAAAARAAFELEQHDRAEALRLEAVAGLVERARADLGGLEGVATADDLLARVTGRIASVEALVAAEAGVRVAMAAAGAETPDTEALAAQEAAARADADAAVAARDDQQQVHADLTRRAASLGAYATELATLLDDRERTVGGTAAVIGLADIVTAARGSANAKKVSLESYAVQRRFASVLEAASVHLERMSGGKYSLDLDDSARGNQQAGLGISVLDAWTGQTRDPRTLSGGETFYVSLALALGLADVVSSESGGVEMETLFVDEGFGALDQDTLNLVLEQLDHLRSGGKVIGVVSHVTEMKEWLSDRIEVSVGPDRTSGARVLPG